MLEAINNYDSIVEQSVLARGGKSGRFHEFKSQKIFSKTRFDKKYLGKHHGIESFANQKSSVMVNSN